MEFAADILMTAGAFGAAFYCYVLAQRLRRFQTLETGMGGAIAVLSAQVDDMTRALDKARGAANGQAEVLEAMVARGEAAAARLELLVASLHDLPAAPDRSASDPAPSHSPGPSAPEIDLAVERRLRFTRRRTVRAGLEAAE